MQKEITFTHHITVNLNPGFREPRKHVMWSWLNIPSSFIPHRLIFDLDKAIFLSSSLTATKHRDQTDIHFKLEQTFRKSCLTSCIFQCGVPLTPEMHFKYCKNYFCLREQCSGCLSRTSLIAKYLIHIGYMITMILAGLWLVLPDCRTFFKKSVTCSKCMLSSYTRHVSAL